MQTILGSGGGVGTLLAKSLTKYTEKIKLFSRNPKKVNKDDILMPGDLTKSEDVDKAVEGSEIVYLMAGFQYRVKVWREVWPKVMSNVLEACEKYSAKFVFFDNIYMYDKEHLTNMDENTPINPPSKKGIIRAEIFYQFMLAVEANKIEGLVARCADYYGQGVENTSVLSSTVFNPLSENKKATWLGSDSFPHSFTFTKDAAEATALLGNTNDAYGEVWHLPTQKHPPTGKEWIQMIAEKMNKEPKYRIATTSMLKFAGIFSPLMRELVEMNYQFDRPYVFNSDKFEKKFNYKPISYEKGIEKIIEADYSGK
ncbi:MAG: NAD-dependent epimerase/dehydratase family protein [Melioribacteraceae bacterium]|nr:NAD-dependent epimerase/dehydratase family protein [Melioribacteraceae bacterium]